MFFKNKNSSPEFGFYVLFCCAIYNANQIKYHILVVIYLF